MSKKLSPRLQSTEDQVEAALTAACGIYSVAAQMLNVNREAVWRRVQKSERLQKVVAQMREQIVDLAEHSLLNRLKAGDTAAIKFVLLTLGRHRGYALTGADAASSPALPSSVPEVTVTIQAT